MEPNKPKVEPDYSCRGNNVICLTCGGCKVVRCGCTGLRMCPCPQPTPEVDVETLQRKIAESPRLKFSDLDEYLTDLD